MKNLDGGLPRLTQHDNIRARLRARTEVDSAALERITRLAGQTLGVSACWIALGEPPSEDVVATWQSESACEEMDSHAFHFHVAIRRSSGLEPAFLHVADPGPRAIDASLERTLDDFAALAADFLDHPTTVAPGEWAATASSHLRELHRLNTTAYERLEDQFADFLRTGMDILSLPSGAVVELVEDKPVLRTAVGLETSGPVVSWDPLLCRGLRQRRTCLCRLPRGLSMCARIEADGRLYGALVFWSTEANPVCLFRSQERDILELMARSIGQVILEERLTSRTMHLANHDPVTGLTNRLLFERRLALALDQETHRKPAIIYLGLDRLQNVNDSIGHAAGDEVLRSAAECITRTLPGAEVSRIGGDEFTALLMDREPREVELLAEKLLENLCCPIQVDTHELFLTASIGVSTYPEDGRDARTLLKNAAAAMIGVKARGRNGYGRYTPGVTGDLTRRLHIEATLRHAIDNGELRPLFQPQMTLDRLLTGFEVLLAWESPHFGRIPPGQFIPIAEENGSILAIGRWILFQACSQNHVWQRGGFAPVKIAVNVSPVQFADPGFVDLVSQVLEETGLDPSYLELELTESTIMHDFEESARRMIRLRSVGVSIAIDDFGTGYSSLSYLHRLPVDTLKVDQSFLQDFERHPASSSLVHGVVSLAHARHLSVVAEGVETELQAELLRAAGCDLVQGHLFSPPLEASQAECLLTRVTGAAN